MAARLSAAGKPLGRPPKPKVAAVPPSDMRAVLKAAQVLMRYDAAGRGRKTAGWNPPETGPNTALNGINVLRSRSEDSSRNDGASASAAQKWTTTLIGIGITPRWKRIASKERRKEITDLFVACSRKLDADGVLDYFGMQTLAVRIWFVSGEVFLRFRARFTDEGLPLPFQVQLLEPQMVPMFDATSWKGLPEGNYIRSGIELNKRGKRVAYWVYKQHPNDGAVISSDPSDYVRVAASEMAHMFEPKRAGQLRGVPELAPALLKLRDIGDYRDAVLVRQKIANLFVAFIKRTLPTLDPNDPFYHSMTGTVAQMASEDVDGDVGGTPLLPMAPGLLQELEDGQEVQFANPPEAGTTFSDYIRTEDMSVSAALGLPHELHGGDLRNVSDRTLRVVVTEFRRLAQQRQWQMVIPMFCQRVIDWFVDTGLLTGDIKAGEEQDARMVEHAPHGFEYIHPVQDPQGKQMEVAAGFRSRSSVIAEQGDDPDLVDEERAADQKREKDLGITPPPAATGNTDPTTGQPQQTPAQKQQQARLDQAVLDRHEAEVQALLAQAERLRTPAADDMTDTNRAALNAAVAALLGSMDE